jgi:hypothetical protein
MLSKRCLALVQKTKTMAKEKDTKQKSEKKPAAKNLKEKRAEKAQKKLEKTYE